MLACNAVNVFYGHVHALRAVSLEVRKGECVALLGANGAGKTTLLRAISGLIRQRSGTVHLNAMPIDAMAPEARVRAGIAHAPERRRIFPGLTVMENLEVGTASWRKLRQPIDAELDKVFDLFPRLKERATQRGWTLSGGEQQMLAIARALMARPRVLLLDEPSLGLAPVVADEVYGRLSTIQRDGLTILIVEQNTMMALNVAARAYVLEGGKIVLEGAASDLVHNPKVREAYLGQ